MRAQEGLYGLPTGLWSSSNSGLVLLVAFSGARFYLQCTMYKVLFRSYLLLYILPNEVYQIVSAKIQHLYLCTKFRKKNLQKLRIEGGLDSNDPPPCEGRAPNSVRENERDESQIRLSKIRLAKMRERQRANNCNYSPLEGVRGVEPSLGEGRVRLYKA